MIRKEIVIPIPKEFIGSWTISEVYGTHNCLSKISWPFSFFTTRELAQNCLDETIKKYGGNKDTWPQSVEQVSEDDKYNSPLILTLYIQQA